MARQKMEQRLREKASTLENEREENGLRLGKKRHEQDLKLRQLEQERENEPKKAEAEREHQPLKVFLKKCFGISSRDEENVRPPNKRGRTGKWVESLIVMSGLDFIRWLIIEN